MQRESNDKILVDSIRHSYNIVKVSWRSNHMSFVVHYL